MVSWGHTASLCLSCLAACQPASPSGGSVQAVLWVPSWPLLATPTASTVGDPSRPPSPSSLDWVLMGLGVQVPNGRQVGTALSRTFL